MTMIVDLILVCGDKTYKDLALNRVLGVEDLPRNVNMDKKLLFTASASGFLEQRRNGSIQILKANLNQLKVCNYSQGCLFFVSILCAAILPKINQSSKYFFYLTQIVQIILAEFPAKDHLIYYRLNALMPFLSANLICVLKTFIFIIMKLNL